MARMTEQEKRDRVLELINERPGIGFVSICSHMGYRSRINNRYGKTQCNKAMHATLTALIDAGLITGEHPQPGVKVGLESKLYPAGYVKPKPKPAPPPNHEVAERLQCKSYRVPLDQLHLYIPRRAS